MSLVYRPARAQDLAPADALVVASINDLTTSHGFGPMATPSAPNFQLFSLKDDPDGLWVAEDDGELLGFAWSWVCGDVWILAQLFVDPAQQGRGIGNELMKLTLEHARKSAAAHKVLITFTFNRVSQGLYIRHGLFPRMPIYFLSAARERVIEGLPEPALQSIPIDGNAATMERLAEIDSRAIGVPREKHHRYLLDDPATQRAYRTSRRQGGRRPRRCLCGGIEDSGRQALRDRIGVPARLMRKRAEPCRQSGHAHHLSHAADGVAGLWNLDAIPAAQSGLHVIMSTCF